MPAISATAPGKAILVGEHAVVYSRPAIAIPVTQIQAKASVFADPRGQPGEVWVDAPSIHLAARLSQLPPDHPISHLARLLLAELGLARFPALRLKVTSTIPIAAGLGSGAAVSIATLRALSAFVGHPLADERISALAFEQEKIFHGNPSGIDNTVITYAQPVFFVRGQPFQRLQPGAAFSLVIADTGVRSSTAVAVSAVRERWQQDTPRYERLFDQAGEISLQVRSALEAGQTHTLGPLMNENQAVLQEIGVSSPKIDRLVEAARHAGALGAKLSGAGLGGNIIALVDPAQVERVTAALSAAGAVHTWVTQVTPKPDA